MKKRPRRACRRDKMAFRERELAEPMPSFSLDPRRGP